MALESNEPNSRTISTILSNTCSNCNKPFDNDVKVSLVQVQNIYENEIMEIHVWDAVSYIYGVTWEEFYNHLKDNLGAAVGKEIFGTFSSDSVAVCKLCAPVLLSNYTAHRKFEHSIESASIIQLARNYSLRRPYNTETVCPPLYSISTMFPKKEKENNPWDFLYSEEKTKLISSVPLFSDVTEETLEYDGSANDPFFEFQNESTDQHCKEPSQSLQVSEREDTLENQNSAVIPEFSCYICGKTFGSWNSLNTYHIPTHKLDDSRNICPPALSDLGKWEEKSAAKLNEIEEVEVMDESTTSEYSSTFLSQDAGDSSANSNSVTSEEYLSNFVEHSSTKSTDLGDYQCHRCGKRNVTWKEYKTHLDSHDSNYNESNSDKNSSKSKYVAEYQCHRCGERIVTWREYKTHMGSHDPICSESNSAKNSSPKSKDVGNYQCHHCEKRSATLKEYNKHMDSHNPNYKPTSLPEKTLICRICNKRFRRMGHINHHIKYTHRLGEELQKECKLCGKLIATYNMKVHLMWHSERVKCDECDVWFLNRERYEDHVLSHEDGFVPYSCKNCQKTFTERFLLVRHEKLHRKKKAPCRKPKSSAIDTPRYTYY